jgi:hypothetical protein
MEPERKERLGTKWVCYACETRFYDLKKPEPICPKCEADQRESPTFEKKTPRSRAKAKRKTAAKKKTAKRKASLADISVEPATTPPRDEDTALPVDQIDPSEVASEISVDD